MRSWLVVGAHAVGAGLVEGITVLQETPAVAMVSVITASESEMAIRRARVRLKEGMTASGLTEEITLALSQRKQYENVVVTENGEVYITGDDE